MLPFLQPKKLASVIMARTKKDSTPEMMHEEGEQHPELMQHAESLMQAMHNKDTAKVAEAMSNFHNHMNKNASPKKEE